MAASATPLLSLLAFVGWTLLMAGAVGLIRSGLVVIGGRAANSFPLDKELGDSLERRLTRVQMNCAENLPIFASLILVAAISGGFPPAYDWMAPAIVISRVGQSLVHAASVGPIAVQVRFAFFLVQYVLMIAMLLPLLSRLV